MIFNSNNIAVSSGLPSSYRDSFRNEAVSIFAIDGAEIVKTAIAVYLSPRKMPFAHNGKLVNLIH